MMVIQQNFLYEYWDRAKVSFRLWGIHLKRRWYFYVLPIFAFAVFHYFYMISVNVSQSLKGSFFITVRNVLPDKRGDYVSFFWLGDINYAKGVQFTKRVAGIAGDEVIVVGRNVFVNGNFIGMAKEVSKRGMPLEVIKPGRIPDGYIFVQGDHKDSLDSRYALCGLIDMKNVIGKSYLVF